MTMESKVWRASVKLQRGCRRCGWGLSLAVALLTIRFSCHCAFVDFGHQRLDRVRRVVRRSASKPSPSSSSIEELALPPGADKLNELAEAGAYEEAERLYAEVEPRTTLQEKRVILNTMIEACARAGKVDEAERWFTKFRKLEIDPDALTFGKMMKAVGNEAAKSRSGKELFGLTPVVQMRPKQERKHRDPVMPEWFMTRSEKMRREDREVSTYDNEHTEKAEKWLNEMKLASVKPDKTVYVEMMTAFAKAGVPAVDTFKLHQRMIEDEVEPDLETYTAPLAAFVGSDNLLEATRWLKKSLFHADPSVDLFRPLLQGYADRGMFLQAQRVFNTMILYYSLPPDVESYSLLIKACAKKGANAKAEYYRRKMSEQGLQMDDVCWNSLIDCYGRSGYWAKALHYLRELPEHNIEPDAESYNSVINAVSKREIDKAYELCDEMRQKGLRPSLASYTSILGRHFDAKDLDATKKCLNDMKQMDIELDDEHKTWLKKALGRRAHEELLGTPRNFKLTS